MKNSNGILAGGGFYSGRVEVIKGKGIRKVEVGRYRAIRELTPCGGWVEYLHRDPVGRRKRRKGKFQI
jgi:hypothetical protein